MDSKTKFQLYRGILLGCSGNSLINKFKLVRAISKNKGIDNLYSGWRFDNLNIFHFLEGDVLRTVSNPDRLDFWTPRVPAKISVFRHDLDNGNYYDVLDGNKLCTLVDRNVTDAEFACFNLDKVDSEGIVKLKIRKAGER